MTTKPGGYKPLTEEQRNKIKKMWDLYKDSIGLEGNIVLKLIREGRDMGEVDRAVEEHRENIKDNLEAWHSLRKES